MSQDFRLLGLDPGGSTGYAWTEDPRVEVERSGVWELGKIAKPGRRFGYLLGQLDLFEPTHVAYERPFSLRGKPAQTWHYGYLAVVQLWCERNGAEFAEVNPKELKAYATGRSGASKEDMQRMACRRFKSPLPMTFEHDRVDALWVLAWGIHAFAFDVPHSRDCRDAARAAGATS